MANLTQRQREAYAALHGDEYLSFSLFGAKTGASAAEAKKRYHRACFLLGEIPKVRLTTDPLEAALAAKKEDMARMPQESARDHRTRVDGAKGKYGMADLRQSPELEAEAIYKLSDPQLASIADAARSANMKPETLRRLMRKLSEGMTPVTRVVQDVRMDYLSKLAGDNAQMIAESVDEIDMKSASLKDKAIAFGIFTEKKLLIDGMPTQRLEISDRRHLDELVMESLLEAQRRGMDVSVSDGNAVVTRDRMLPHNTKLDYSETKDAMDAEIV